MDRESENIVRSGQGVVESCLVYSSTNAIPFDLTSVWMTISIYESIGTDYIRLEMSFTDTQNLIQKIPIVANERIVVRYKTQGADETRVFAGRITSVPVRADISQDTQVFSIQAITEEFVYNQKVKFSKSYKDVLISDMVTDIFDQYVRSVSGKEIAIIPTLERESKVVPNYSPMRAINWLTKWARAPQYRTGASYVFYQNVNNFFFGPLEYLMDERSISQNIPTYKYSINVMNDDAKTKNIETGMYNIINFGTRSIDHMEMIREGASASTVLSHDLVLGTRTTTTYDYFESFEDTIHLEKNPVSNDVQMGKYPNSRFLLNPEHYSAFGGDTNSNRTRQTASTRFSQLSQLKGSGLEVLVPGDSNRTIGEIVNVELPSIGQLTKDSTFGDTDKYLSSKYLVWNLRHELTRGPSGNVSYNLHMRLLRDSNRNEIPTQVAFPFGGA